MNAANLPGAVKRSLIRAGSHGFSKIHRTRRVVYLITILIILMITLLQPKFTAFAAPILTVTPITWNVVGLDSNNVNEGPNMFPVGVRVCNIGDSPATNVTTTFVWDSANVYIDLSSGSLNPILLGSLANGQCTDVYFDVTIMRTPAAYDTTRQYHIEVAAAGLATVSTPTPREIYVEHLISQNRNSVLDIQLNGVSIGPGGVMNLILGKTYTITLIGNTATNGYEQIETFINFPNQFFRVLNVATIYTADGGTDPLANSKLYADGCNWVDDPTVVNYNACTATGKYGGMVTIVHTVEIIGGVGINQTLNTLIYDFSGSSYHYNNSFSLSARYAIISDPPTPTSTATNTSTATSTNTSTATPSDTPTSTATNTATATPTNTSTTIPSTTPTTTTTATPTNSPTATSTASPSDTPTSTATATQTNTPTPSSTAPYTPSADLHLHKSVSDSSHDVGTELTFEISVKNIGPDNATGIVVSEILPNGFTYISSIPSQGTYNSGTHLWDVGDLAVNVSATLTITVRINESGSYNNTAEITASGVIDPDSTPNNHVPGEDDQASVTISPQTPNPPRPLRTPTPTPQPAFAGFFIPVTGFKPDVVTDLSRVPNAAYVDTSITLDIPALSVNIPIVGVPKENGAWNVAWLGNQAGWLEGSAFPSWNGNSVLTSHVYLSNGKPGPFAKLHELKTGDQVFVHAFGQKYTFEVLTNAIISPNDKSVMQHEESPWLTLVTCTNYDQATGTYKNRFIVRAVLVKVSEDK